jgi:heme exporter protein A
VTLERGGRDLFTPVNLSVLPGELWLIEGANGQGKSSLLRVLAGLDQPAVGRVSRETSEALAWLGHHLPLKEDFSAWENAQRLALLFGLPSQVRQLSALKAALQAFGLWPKRHDGLKSYSAGMKRRLYLALLSLHPSPLWLLDEPYTSLDSTGQQLLDALVLKQLAAGKSLILTSHQPLSPALACKAQRLVLEGG